MLKRKCLIVFGLLASLFLPSMAQAQCAFSTCITAEMIGIGQNALVDNADPETKFKEITGKDAPDSDSVNCDNSPMVQTGVTIYRLYAPQKLGEYKQYDEHFCLSQGCSFQGGLMGSPDCSETPL